MSDNLQPAPLPSGDLAGRIRARTATDPSYWDFSEVSNRSGSHGFFQYPAMMVPELQGALLDDLIGEQPEVTSVYDPFMGSGTVMLEARFRGLGFVGTDINSMAVLLCQVKSNPPSGELALAASKAVLDLAQSDRNSWTLEFLHHEKWFSRSVAHDLTRLRESIKKIDDLSIRRYLWVCLAETVRRVSNSRMSTFKLHVYEASELAERSVDTFATFASVGTSNARRAGEHWRRQMTASSGVHLPEPILLRGDVFDSFSAPKKVDAVMTSPPYGDNHTTVPYGQHSYLPLCWIDHADLVGVVQEDLLATPASLDTASLGGSRAFRAERVSKLPLEIPSLGELFHHIAGHKALEAKVTSFVDDYRAALGKVSDRLEAGGYSFWTLGERRVRGFELPLVAVTREILEARNHVHVETVTRRLRRKRMAGKNNLGSTMGFEQILVMRKAVGA